MISKQNLLALALALLVASSAPAAQSPEKPRWTDLIIEPKARSHDFGVVAVGADVEHRFVLYNPFVEDLHIASLRTTCGCTAPRATKTLLKTYETAEIIAKLDTLRFKGFKQATITVILDQRYPAEIQLHANSFIRQDVVFQPGSVQFGTLGQGQSAAKRVAVMYAGRSDWKIVQIASSSRHLEVKAVETGRNRDPTYNATQVTYDLEVKLKGEAPPGYFKEELSLRTNDPNPQTASVPLAVEGFVTTPLTVYPSMLMLGSLQTSESVARNIVLKGDAPFRVLELSAPDERFQFTANNQLQPVCVVAVRFTADQSPGKVAGKIIIKTDRGVVQLGVNGEVVRPQSDPGIAQATGDLIPPLKGKAGAPGKSTKDAPGESPADPLGQVGKGTPGKDKTSPPAPRRKDAPAAATDDTLPLPLDPPDSPQPKRGSTPGPVRGPILEGKTK